MSAWINLSGMTTLVADSDRFTRDITAQIIRGFGAEPCTLVDTGAEAIRCILHNCFDLCILEAKLPDMFCGELDSLGSPVERPFGSFHAHPRSFQLYTASLHCSGARCRRKFGCKEAHISPAVARPHFLGRTRRSSIP